MATQGPNSGATFVDDASVGTVVWLNPSNAATSNNIRATCALGLGSTGHYLKATNFGFSIPDGATIDGVTVEIERGSGIAAGFAIDNSVRLVKGGAISGDNMADLISNWPGVDTYNPYGGPTELWGLALTPTDINASDFGVVVSAVEGGDGGITLRCDHIRITIDYTAAADEPRLRSSMSMMGFGS